MNALILFTASGLSTSSHEMLGGVKPCVRGWMKNDSVLPNSHVNPQKPNSTHRCRSQIMRLSLTLAQPKV